MKLTENYYLHCPQKEVWLYPFEIAKKLYSSMQAVVYALQILMTIERAM